MNLYWEWIFLSGLFGSLALYPAVNSYLSLILINQDIYTALISAAAFVFAAIVLHAEWHKHRTAKWLVAATLVTGVAAVAFARASVTTTPQLTVWFTDVCLTLLTLGYMIVKHFLRSTERYFLHNWQRIVVIALGVTCASLLFAQLAVFVPAGLLGFLAAVGMLLHALPSHHE